MPEVAEGKRMRRRQHEEKQQPIHSLCSPARRMRRHYIVFDEGSPRVGFPGSAVLRLLLQTPVKPAFVNDPGHVRAETDFTHVCSGGQAVSTGPPSRSHSSTVNP